uniref:DUF629 domain-containing protein n=1 Tax=Oryza glumipatula TaxID=40148 RepID=A0A0E0ADC8_9ORYZ
MGRGRGKHRKEAEAAREEEELRRLLEASPLRKEAVEAMRLDREGRHDEAIARVDELAAKHPESAVVLHLAAGLHQNASIRSARDGSDGQASVMHLVYARDLYAQAKRLAPNCVQIATGFAMAKVASAKDHEPDREIMRALAISSPTDPAENNVAFDLDRTLSTAMDRLAKAREAALFHSHHIMSHMSAKIIPAVVVDMLDISKREGAATAKKQAKKALVERFNYSARAHLTHAKISLDFARGLDPNIDKKPFLNSTLDALNNLVEEFSNSLEIAMFRAKLWFVMGKYCSVEVECDRAIRMEEPTDPREEDVPPGSIPGEKPEDRKSYIRTELKRLLQKLVLVCRDYWCSLASEKQDSFRLVGLKYLHLHFVTFYQDDHEAAKTISDALNFVKKNKSWRFWICPYCVGKKIPDIDSLLQHMRSKHPEGGFWTNLPQVFDPESISDTYQGDHFSDNATICQDSEENYVLHFKRMDDIFKYLFLRAVDNIEEKPFSQIREEKCRKGVFILEKIKLKLNNVPTDISSSEFNEACAEIRDLWRYFLEISLMDYRVAISPLAMCFISDQLLTCMTEDKEAASNSIDVAAINAVFPFVDVCPDIDAIFPNVDDAPDGNDADTSTSVTPGQSAEEMPSIDVPNKENKDKDMFILHVIIQSLWNLRCFRDEILRAPPATILHIKENFCIADLFYGIFFAWENNEHNGVDVLLTSLKVNLCKIANDNMFQKAGKRIASEVVATILQALHMSETPLHFDFNSEIEEREIESFAELLVLYDEQLCFGDNCKHCGSPKNVDVSPSNTPHIFTIGLYWFGDCENQVQLSEVLVGIAHPIDIKLLCKGVHSSAKYSLASMISYANGRYFCFARDQDKWLISDAETIEAEDSWEQLLERFRDCRLQPEVLFFEIIN